MLHRRKTYRMSHVAAMRDHVSAYDCIIGGTAEIRHGLASQSFWKKKRMPCAAAVSSTGDAVLEIGAKAVSLTGIFAVAYVHGNGPFPQCNDRGMGKRSVRGRNITRAC